MPTASGCCKIKNKFLRKIFAQSTQNAYLCVAKAQMAELVDALVSNTSGFTSMPVRPRLWVLKRGKLKNFPRFLFYHIVTHWFADILG